MKIGVIGAMNEEIERMKAEMIVTDTLIHATVTFYEGMLNEKEIILCKCGVGKVNAALTTQILVNQFDITYLLFTGVAGAVDESWIRKWASQAEEELPYLWADQHIVPTIPRKQEISEKNHKTLEKALYHIRNEMKR